MCPEFSACYSIEWTTEGKEVVYQILLPKLNRAAYQDHDFHKHNALLYFLTIFILAYLSSNHARKNLDFQGKSILFWINIWFFNREPEAVFVPQVFVPENLQLCYHICGFTAIESKNKGEQYLSFWLYLIYHLQHNVI